jgi:AraC-like DNA-binding protein
MSQDILSDVLRGVRLRGAVFFYLSFGRQWATGAPAASEIAAAVLPGSEHVMEYHVLTRGAGWAAVAGQSPVRLAAGDIVMFPHGDAHVLSSAPGLEPLLVDPGWFDAHRGDDRPILISQGGPQQGVTVGAPAAADADTNVVCGFLGCDLRPFNPLIANLPRLMHLRADDDGAWMIETLRQAVLASCQKKPGSEVVLERISEMMFVHAVRRYVEAMSEPAGGWLAGLRDRYVGRALALLHEAPAEAWTVDELGRRVGLSRSALHERFTGLIGQPPMQYLTQWRMQVASKLLRDGTGTVASIALEVGYDSEAAFARAFKRSVGTPPAAWRRKCQ